MTKVTAGQYHLSLKKGRITGSGFLQYLMGVFLMRVMEILRYLDYYGGPMFMIGMVYQIGGTVL